MEATMEESLLIEDELRALVEPSGFPAPNESSNTPNRRGGLRRRSTGFKHVTQLGSMLVHDHPTLKNPSSAVAFANDEVIVFVDTFDQLTLEKNDENEYITAKQATVATPGLIIIHALYALVAFLVAGLLFVFCVQILFFLFLGIAIDVGKLVKEHHDLMHILYCYSIDLMKSDFLNVINYRFDFSQHASSWPRCLWDSTLYSCVHHNFVPNNGNCLYFCN